MLYKIKQYYQYVLTGLLFVITGAFLYEKSKADNTEALVDNEKTLQQVEVLKAQTDINDTKLQSEEDRRSEIKKEAENAQHNDTTDSTTFLSKR